MLNEFQSLFSFPYPSIPHQFIMHASRIAGFLYYLSSVAADPNSSTHAFTTQDIAAAEQVSLHELTVPELSPSDPTGNIAVLRRSEARAKERNSVL